MFPKKNESLTGLDVNVSHLQYLQKKASN